MHDAFFRMTILVALLFAATANAQPTLPGGGGASGGSSGGGSGGGASTPQYWGAVSYTARGSYSSAWKQPSKEVAEAAAATKCAAFGHGACKTIGFPGELCVALVHLRAGRSITTFSAGGTTYPEAQRQAMENCQREDRSRRGDRCKLLGAVCGDGR